LDYYAKQQLRNSCSKVSRLAVRGGVSGMLNSILLRGGKEKLENDVVI
jgi:hypothetical protein